MSFMLFISFYIFLYRFFLSGLPVRTALRVFQPNYVQYASTVLSQQTFSILSGKIALKNPSCYSTSTEYCLLPCWQLLKDSSHPVP